MADNENLYEVYQQRRGTLLQTVKDQHDVVSKLKLDDLYNGESKQGVKPGERLNGLIESLSSDKLRVLIMGSFSSGKSTFINALVGYSLLPSSPRPCTGVMSWINYAEELNKRAMLYPKDGSSPVEVHIEELEDYIKINHGDVKDKTSEYKRIEIGWPLSICEKGVEIIDSIGTDDPDSRDEVTFEYAKTVDAILYIMKGIDACTRKDMDALGALNVLGFEAPFLVVTYFDHIKQSVQLGEITEAQFRSTLEKDLGKLVNINDAGIMCVDSRSALLGKKEGDSAKVEESGINAVEASLEQYLVDQKGRAKLLVSLRALRAVNKEARQVIPERISMLGTSTEELQQRYAAVQKELRILESKRQLMVGRVKTTLHDIARDAFDLADAYFLDLPGKLGEWADDFEITSSIGFPPRKSTLSKVVEEVAGHLRLKIQKDAGLWNKETLSPMVEKRVAGLMDSMEDEARGFLRSADAIRVNVALGKELVADEMPEMDGPSIWGRIAAGGYALICMDFVTGGMGMLLGIRAMLNTIMLQIVAGIVLVVFNMFNPVAIVLAALAAIAGGGILNALSLKKEIKKKVTKELGDHLRSERKNLAKKVERHIQDELDKLHQAIDTGLGNEINKVKSQVKTVLSEKQKGDRNVKDQVEMLLSLQKKNDDIDTFLEEMFTEIGLGERRVGGSNSRPTYSQATV